jgi:hypothetical protein
VRLASEFLKGAPAPSIGRIGPGLFGQCRLVSVSNMSLTRHIKPKIAKFRLARLPPMGTQSGLFGGSVPPGFLNRK